MIDDLLTRHAPSLDASSEATARTRDDVLYRALDEAPTSHPTRTSTRPRLVSGRARWAIPAVGLSAAAIIVMISGGVLPSSPIGADPTPDTTRATSPTGAADPVFRLAAAVQAQDFPGLQPGQVRHIVTKWVDESPGKPSNRQFIESWTTFDGRTYERRNVGDGGFDRPWLFEPGSEPGLMPAARAAQLPTDPTALIAALRTDPSLASWGGDPEDAVSVALGAIVRSQTAPSTVIAAAIRALAMQPGMKLLTDDGRGTITLTLTTGRRTLSNTWNLRTGESLGSTIDDPDAESGLPLKSTRTDVTNEIVDAVPASILATAVN